MLSPEKISQISQESLAFEQRKKSLGLTFSKDQPHVSMELLSLLHREANLLAPVYFSPHDKWGKWGYYLKKILNKLSKPLVKTVLVHQQNFNDVVTVLADRVILLENRIQELETKLLNK